MKLPERPLSPDDLAFAEYQQTDEDRAVDEYRQDRLERGLVDEIEEIGCLPDPYVSKWVVECPACQRMTLTLKRTDIKKNGFGIIQTYGCICGHEENFA